MERPDEAAPGPVDDPFALGAPAPRPVPQRAEADIFDLGAGPHPSRGGDVFQLGEPAPPAPVASAAPEPEPEEAEADGDLFPGLASRESRRRYLEGLARPRPSVKVAVMIDSAAGESIAAPRPWPARAANSVVASAASAVASEEAVNTVRPVRNTRRRPSRSAARPPRSRRLPKISE